MCSAVPINSVKFDGNGVDKKRSCVKSSLGRLCGVFGKLSEDSLRIRILLVMAHIAYPYQFGGIPQNRVEEVRLICKKSFSSDVDGL